MATFYILQMGLSHYVWLIHMLVLNILWLSVIISDDKLLISLENNADFVMMNQWFSVSIYEITITVKDAQ